MRIKNLHVTALPVAVGVIASVAVGCSHKTGDAPSLSSASSAASSAISSITASPSEKPSTTQIPGKNGTPYTVEGPILAKWNTLNDVQKKDLGAPYDNQKETLDRSGVYQQFDGGVLIYRNGEPVYFVWGKIRDTWNENQASQGKLGYPTADEMTESDGSFKSTFEHGTITFKVGDADAKVSLTN